MRLHDFLDFHAREHPRSPFAICGERTLDYGDALREVHRVGHALVRSGVAPGQRVAILACRPNAEMGDPEYQRRFGMRTVDQAMLNVHHPIDAVEEVPERLPTVVATDAMPPPDWRRAKTFAWLTDLLYFERLLQVPIG